MNSEALYLLAKWRKILHTGKERAILKISKLPDKLNGRIKRTDGEPIIFDLESYQQQKSVQRELQKLLPDLSDIITMQPSALEGYEWTREDYVDLYFSHYNLIIDILIRRIGC